MKIFIIHGQSHKGSSYNMGRMLAKKLANENDITEFFLPRDLNHFCVGCYCCIENEEKCPFWNEKKVIIDAMQQADLFIFTSPNYCLGPSGAMKSFIDLMFDYWMVHRPKKWMFEKRAVVISASAGASCSSVIKAIKSSLFYWGVPYIKAYACAVAATSWNTIKPEKKEKIEKDITHLAKKLTDTKKPHVGFKTKFIFKVMGMMHKKGWDSSPTEKKYWCEQGWLNNNRPWKS